MSDITRVDGNQLKQWADRISARSELPRLVRKLILETGRDVVQLGFPAGEGVSAGDWDGSVRANASTPFIPQGLSVWELSVNKSPGKKADEDYSKRTATPDGTPTGEATYVAVSLRPWTKRAEWAREKLKDKRWGAVRAYGVDDVETWLENAPVTHAWLAEQLGLEPYGLRAAEAWWQTWANSTSPAITPDLVLAGRDSLSKSLREQLVRSPAITTIKATSVEEVLAFAAALAVDMENEDNAKLLARLAFVDSVPTWRALQGLKEPLILVPTTEEVRKEVGGRSPHHVVVPLTSGSVPDFELPPIDPDAARQALKASGIEDEQKLKNLSYLAPRSLLALRRTLAVKPELHSPKWAAIPGTRTIRAVLLAGRWNGVVEGDQAVIEELAGLKDEDLREALDALEAEEDPLVGRLEQAWALTSPYDAWLQLRSQLQNADLKRLEKAIRTVLLEKDPALTFPPEERWRASFEEKTSSYSGSLKRGLAESILLLAINGDEVAGGRGEDFAAYLVRTLFEEANKDSTGMLWSSLAPQLRLLGEAAPDSFLEAVRDGLAGDSPVLKKLFTDPKGQSALFTAGSPHCELLWALETVVWSPEHFGLAVDLLAQLSAIDPGGQLSNRPSESLKCVFCPWHPENAADNASRLTVVDSLRKNHPDIAWDLMLSMLPESHGVHSPTSAPNYRAWKPSHQRVTNVEYFEFVGEVAQRLVEDAGSSGGRWATLLDRGSDLLADGRRSIREGLANKIDEIPAEERRALWESLRSFIARHREYAEADWALPPAELDEYEALQDRLSPASAIDTRRWLFAEHSPDLGTSKLDDLAKYEEDLEERRAAAAQEIEAEAGLSGLLSLASESEYPGAIGWALAMGTKDRHDSTMLALLDSKERPEVSVASAYFSKRFRQDGWDRLEDLLDSEKPNARIAGRLLLATRDFPKAWEIGESRGTRVEQAFWREFEPYGLGKFEYVGLAAQKLLDVGRPATSLRLLELYLRKDTEDSDEFTILVADALDALLKVDVKDSPAAALEGLSQYSFDQLFEYLEAHRQAVGEDRLARLEWAYLGALGYDPNVPMLHEQLASSPQFFVEVISALYKERSAEAASEPTEEAKRIAENGYRLLSSWSLVPGQGEDGEIDEAALRKWIDEAQELLKAADRLEVGEAHIGHILASSGRDAEDRWPSEPVRNVLEQLQSKRIEEGFRIQKYNSRGVVSKSLDAGGEQELELAEMYEDWAKAFKDQWPRTASTLRDLAKSYRRDAKHHDAEAEQRRRGFDR